MSRTDEQEAEALYREGMEAFGERRLGDALAIADRLLELRNSGTYEIRALVLDAQRETEAAVACLEEGVSKAPEVWLLWELLGNYRSDLERYEDAAAAYEAALRCPHVDEGYVRLNQGVLLGRMGRPEAALETLDAIEDPHQTLRVLAARLGILMDLGRNAEVEELGRAALDGDLEAGQSAPEAVSVILRHTAAATRALGEDVSRVRPLLLESVAWDTDSRYALQMLRDLDPQLSDDTRLWSVVMDGRDERLPGVGFIVRHDVAADTAYEAYEFAREIESSIGFDHLELDEAEEGDPRPELPKGVYTVGIRHTYESEE